MPNKPITIEFLNVSTPQGHGGMLSHAEGSYVFQYGATAGAAVEISLTMPRRVLPYISNNEKLFPIFEMNLPEGYVLEQLRSRFAKASNFDPMLLLAITGQEAAIGRVAVETPLMPATGSDAGISLDTILKWKGAEDLFASLSQRYLLRTGLSGVQPKLLVPEAIDAEPIRGKGTLATRDLIVKAGDAQFPALAINEFICMSIARKAGIPVPEFHLSENRKLFVVRRFDRMDDERVLGFEDMTVLMGRSAADKYKGSYRQIANALRLFLAPEHVAQGLAQLFDQVALSVMVGNGDAHLKNFGILYSDPTANDARMAPAYDIVNTTRYIPEDGLALSLGGSRNLFTAHIDILDFAQECNVAEPIQRLQEILSAAESVLAAHSDLLLDEPELRAAITHGLERVASGLDRLPAPPS
jgi:serine/threonine-protein kinase HipA